MAVGGLIIRESQLPGQDFVTIFFESTDDFVLAILDGGTFLLSIYAKGK